MARALWTGSLSFGLVNVPVSVVAATRDLDLHFRQLHRKDGARSTSSDGAHRKTSRFPTTRSPTDMSSTTAARWSCPISS